MRINLKTLSETVQTDFYIDMIQFAQEELDKIDTQPLAYRSFKNETSFKSMLQTFSQIKFLYINENDILVNTAKEWSDQFAKQQI